MEGKKKQMELVSQKINRDQLLTVADLETFRIQLVNEIKDLLALGSQAPAKKWLKSGEVKKLLGISTGTLQNLRIRGLLSFNKVGGTLFYDYAEIVKMMERDGRG